MNRYARFVGTSVLAASLCFQGLNAGTLFGPMAVYADTTVVSQEGFEGGGTGSWMGKDGATVSVVAQNPHTGENCMKISNRQGTYCGAKMSLAQLKKGKCTLRVSAYVRYETGPDTKEVQVKMQNNNNYTPIGSVNLTKGEWGKISGTLNVTADMDLSAAVVYFETPYTSSPNTENDLMDLYVDDILVESMTYSDTSAYPSMKEKYDGVFKIGVAVPNPALQQEEFANMIKQQYNSITMENELKPQYILDENASKANIATTKEHAAVHFDACVPGLNFAKENGISMRGHVLVWHSQTPDWFFYENYDTSGSLASRELMLKRMENYIKDVIEWTETNYPGVIYAWDVVNEAASDVYYSEGMGWHSQMRKEETSPGKKDGSLWCQVIGEDFVQKAFEYARKYTTQYAQGRTIKLFYNDYNEYFGLKREAMINMLKPVKEAGNIDGIGMQSHIDVDRQLEGNDGYITALRDFHNQLGLEIHITELDVGMKEGYTLEAQGTYYNNLMTALQKEKKNGVNITSVTFWGLSDALTWRPGTQCLLFAEDLSAKPAFQGVIDAAPASSDNPSENPSDQPSDQPSDKPSDQPSDKPSDKPSDQPSDKPSDQPSDKPSDQPSDKPSNQPSDKPSDQPSDKPSDQPKDESGSTGGNTSGSTGGNTSGNTNGNTSGNTNGSTSGNTNGSTSGNTSSSTSGNTSGSTSGTGNADKTGTDTAASTEAGDKTGTNGAGSVRVVYAVDGSQYAVGADGAAITDKLVSIGGKTYYAGKNGTIAKSKLIKLSKTKMVFAGSDGTIVKGKLCKSGKEKYYAGKNGYLVMKKWVRIGNKKYYCSASGKITKTKKVK